MSSFHSPIPPARVLTLTIDCPALVPTTTAPAARDAPATVPAATNVVPAFALAPAIDVSKKNISVEMNVMYLKALQWYFCKLTHITCTLL